ncbi:hypothetical protein LC55x_4969 [Lysobacter capsici]|nr:hypothetical protein LC55x_4969 [Lysobacter capsici]
MFIALRTPFADRNGARATTPGVPPRSLRARSSRPDRPRHGHRVAQRFWMPSTFPEKK